MEKIAESKISSIIEIDGKLIAVGSYDGTVTLFNLEELRKVRSI